MAFEGEDCVSNFIFFLNQQKVINTKLRLGLYKNKQLLKYNNLIFTVSQIAFKLLQCCTNKKLDPTFTYVCEWG